MRIAIIGGGAAGLMAAATLYAEHPTAEIFLLERNNGLGKKVIISGGGRCNVTTGIQDVRTQLTKYPRGAKFLTAAMYAFPPAAVTEWFESRGVPLKTEEDLRVFPQSDDGHDIVRVFERLLIPPHVHVILNTQVTGITQSSPASRGGARGGGVSDPPPLPGGEREGVRFAIHTKQNPSPLTANRIILTTGGQAYRHTGSTGDGYAFAMSLGHTLTPLAPSLNALFTREQWPAEVSGLSFERATITAPSASFTGPFLFTHKGISGPAVFALSSLVAFTQYDVAHPLNITIDCVPDTTAEELHKQLAQTITAHPTKSLTNVLATIMPKSLAAICVRECELPGEKRAAEASKQHIMSAITWFKAIPLHAIQRGAGDEFVTAGGIPLTEVSPSTMESHICPGLFFAGEILDIDGFTGGFNLQASWATGHLAGTHAAK